MSYSVLTAKNDLQGVLHGTQLNQITNLNGIFNRAARQLLLDVDPQETKRIVQFANPIYNDVFDYPIAADVKGNAIIDIRPQVQRLPRDIWSQAYNQAFDIAKQNLFALKDMFTMNFNTGLKTLRVNAPFLNAPLIVNYADNVTSNGTWYCDSSDATDFRVDNVNYVAGGGSVAFTIAQNAAAAQIINGTMSPVDLSTIENQGSLFFWIYFTDATAVTKLIFTVGNSVNGQYPDNGWFKDSITTNQQGVALVNGWNLIAIPWTSLTKFGTPDITAVNGVVVELDLTNTEAAQVMRVNLFEGILGSILEYEYYSKYLFRDASTGAFQETVTDDSNLINLDTDSYNLLFNLVAYLAVQQQQGIDAQFFDGTFFKNEYDNGVAKYKARYKSETQKPQTSYYGLPPGGYNRVIGRGFWQ